MGLGKSRRSYLKRLKAACCAFHHSVAMQLPMMCWLKRTTCYIAVTGFPGCELARIQAFEATTVVFQLVQM